MAKFSNAKVGDKVWHVIHGWGEIVHIDKNLAYGITARFTSPYTSCEFNCAYTFDGFALIREKHPSIYWNEIKLPTDNEDKKPFGLVDFLKENLTPKDFKIGENNYTLGYSYLDNKLYINVADEVAFLHQYFKPIKDEVVTTLNKAHVTLEQLRKAYEELGWL